MSTRPTHRPVYKALHRALTIWGVERRLFGVGFELGGRGSFVFGDRRGIDLDARGRIRRDLRCDPGGGAGLRRRQVERRRGEHGARVPRLP